MRIESSRVLDLISRGFPGPILYINHDMRYLYANDAALEWYGLKPEEMIGKAVYEVIDAEAYQKREPYLRRTLAGEKVKFVASLKHPKLGYRYLEHTYEPDFDEKGNVLGIFVLAYDLTDQKLAENKARLNESRYKTLTEMMPQLIWETDAEGNVTWMNDNWMSATGTTLEANLGDGWLNVLHPDDRHKTKDDWESTLSGKSRTAVEYRVRMADGTYRWHIARASAVRDEMKKIISWVGTTTDIHDQKTEEDKLKSLLMQAPMPIVLFKGPEFVIDFMNPASISYSNDSTGKPLFKAYPELETQGFRQIMESIYQSGKGIFLTDMPLSLNKADGTSVERFFDFFYEPLKDEKGKVHSIFNIGVDVTDKRNALKRSEEALLARDQFLSIASHELKTPLTSLKLQAQLVMKSMEKNVELSQEKQLSIAHQTNELVSRLSRLIDDMLDVSRIRTGKLRLDKSPCNLSDVIREVTFRMSYLFEAAGMKLPSIIEHQKVTGNWDRFRIEQVIGNLLTNAIRYGLNKPVKIEIFEKDHNAVFSVADQGFGIAEDDLSRIFDRYERVNNTNAISGMGLGLFITKEIVEAHQGKIWVESTVGQGSTFYVSLPL